MSDPLTIFDLDETLISGDSGLIWNEFLVQQGIITNPGFLQEDRRLMALYALGELDMQAYLHFVMDPISQLPCAEVDRLAELCVTQQILPRLYPQAKSMLADLQAQKIDTLMISATVSFLVEKVAKKLAFKDAMGINLVVENGCYSAQISGTATYRSGKVKRLKQWLAEQPTVFAPIDFYTDSINDLPLCLHVDHPTMVNPCAQLKKQAQRYQWPVLAW
ncbi:HAD-IB family hydrolase [Psychromonas sp. MB-3u-54]|uniref:HAD family hydrolase n=1 Tax=Psychromonas sp. MB-3u-54 TaxID=2058319 RepID=UPI000C31B933|nr:HAD family hydrolase [Psychromonas sp. MB-3u-54]PKH02181.1 HAD-IB family hydrolase [Psychromonas sp. MB-3u-54]